MSTMPTNRPMPSEQFLPPAHTKHKSGDGAKEQNEDRERMVCGIGIDVHYELDVVASETGSFRPRLKPFNPRMSGPACPYPYTGKFVEEEKHAALADDPIGLGRLIAARDPYDKELYRKRDPRLVSKCVVVRDYGCKIPIDLADTTKIAQAVLNHFPEQYVGFLGTFVSTLFGAVMRKFLDTQAKGLQRLLDRPEELNRIGWSVYHSVQGGVTDEELKKAENNNDDWPIYKRVDATLSWKKDLGDALRQVNEKGVVLTGQFAPTDVYNLRPCLQQHIATLNMMKDEWCKGFGSDEAHVLCMLYYVNECGRNWGQDLGLINEYGVPDYKRVRLHVPLNFSSCKSAGESLSLGVDDNTSVRASLHEIGRPVDSTHTLSLPVGLWTGSGTNLFVAASDAAPYSWGFGHPSNLAVRRTLAGGANERVLCLPHLPYKNNTHFVIDDFYQQHRSGISKTHVDKQLWARDLVLPKSDVVPKAEKRRTASLRDSLIDEEDRNPARSFRGAGDYRSAEVQKSDEIIAENPRNEADVNIPRRVGSELPWDRQCSEAEGHFSVQSNKTLRKPNNAKKCEFMNPFLRSSGCFSAARDAPSYEVDSKAVGPYDFEELAGSDLFKGMLSGCPSIPKFSVPIAAPAVILGRIPGSNIKFESASDRLLIFNLLRLAGVEKNRDIFPTLVTRTDPITNGEVSGTAPTVANADQALAEQEAIKAYKVRLEKSTLQEKIRRIVFTERLRYIFFILIRIQDEAFANLVRSFHANIFKPIQVFAVAETQFGESVRAKFNGIFGISCFLSDDYLPHMVALVHMIARDARTYTTAEEHLGYLKNRFNDVPRANENLVAKDINYASKFLGECDVKFGLAHPLQPAVLNNPVVDNDAPYRDTQRHDAAAMILMVNPDATELEDAKESIEQDAIGMNSVIAVIDRDLGLQTFETMNPDAAEDDMVDLFIELCAWSLDPCRTPDSLMQMPNFHELFYKKLSPTRFSMNPIAVRDSMKSEGKLPVRCFLPPMKTSCNDVLHGLRGVPLEHLTTSKFAVDLTKVPQLRKSGNMPLLMGPTASDINAVQMRLILLKESLSASLGMYLAAAVCQNTILYCEFLKSERLRNPIAEMVLSGDPSPHEEGDSKKSDDGRFEWNTVRGADKGSNAYELRKKDERGVWIPLNAERSRLELLLEHERQIFNNVQKLRGDKVTSEAFLKDWVSKNAELIASAAKTEELADLGFLSSEIASLGMGSLRYAHPFLFFAPDIATYIEQRSEMHAAASPNNQWKPSGEFADSVMKQLTKTLRDALHETKIGHVIDAMRNALAPNERDGGGGRAYRGPMYRSAVTTAPYVTSRKRGEWSEYTPSSDGGEVNAGKNCPYAPQTLAARYGENEKTDYRFHMLQVSTEFEGGTLPETQTKELLYNTDRTRPQMFAMLDASALLCNARAFFNPSDCNRGSEADLEPGAVDDMHYWCRVLVESFLHARQSFATEHPTETYEFQAKEDPERAFPARLIGALTDDSFRKIFPLLPLNCKVRDELRKVRSLQSVWGATPGFKMSENRAAHGAWMPLSQYHVAELYKAAGLFDEKYNVPSNPWCVHSGNGVLRVFNQSYHSVYHTDSYKAEHFQDWLHSACAYQNPHGASAGCVKPFSQYGGTPVQADFIHHRVEFERPSTGVPSARYKQVVYNRFGMTAPLRLGQQFHDKGYLQDLYQPQYRPHADLSREQRKMRASEVWISNFMSYARTHAILALASCNHGTEEGSVPRIVRNLYRLYVDSYEYMGASPEDDSVPCVMGFLPTPINGKDDRAVTLYAGSLTCLNTKLEKFCQSETNRGERVCKVYKQVYLNDAAILYNRLSRKERRGLLHFNNYLRAKLKRGQDYSQAQFHRELVELQDAYIEFLQQTCIGMLLEGGATLNNVPLQLLEPRELEVSLFEEDDDVVGNDYLTPRTSEILKEMDFSKDNLNRTQMAILSLIPPNHRILSTLKFQQNTEIIDLEHAKKRIQEETIASNKKAWQRYTDALVSAAFAKNVLEFDGPIDYGFDMSAIKDPLKESENIRKRMTTSHSQAASSVSQTVRSSAMRRDRGPDSVVAQNTAEMERALQAVRDRIEREYAKNPGYERKLILAQLHLPEHVKRRLRSEYQ